VSPYARPATNNPTTVPVVKLRRIHVKPQPGVASAMIPSGHIDSKPHSGPRRYQRSGQLVRPTQTPINKRALWYAQTAIEPWM